MATPLPFGTGSVPPDVATERVERQLATFATKEIAGAVERCTLTLMKRLFAAQQRSDTEAAASATAVYVACLGAERQAWARFRDAFLSAGGAPACLASTGALDAVHNLLSNQVTFTARMIFCDGNLAISGLHVPLDEGTYRLMATVGKIFSRYATRHAQCLLKYVERLAAAGGDSSALDAAQLAYDGCYVRRARTAYGAIQRLYAITSGPLCLDVNGAQGVLQKDVGAWSILGAIYCAE
jgi:hypothetical protein